MKLKTALAMLTLLLLAVFVILAVLLIKTSDLLGQTAKEIAAAGERVRLAEELKGRLLIHNRNAFLYTLHREPARLERRSDQRREITGLIDTISGPVYATDDATMADVRQGIVSYFAVRDELAASDLDSIEQYNRVSKDVDHAISAVDKLVEGNRKRMQELVVQIDRRNQAADQAAAILLAIGSVVLLGIMIGIVTMIARPLVSLSKVISAYGNEDHSIRATPGGLMETRKIASVFNSMADRLEEKRRDQLRFLASVAHDLRNPLSSISMAASLLHSNHRGQDHELFEVIVRQVESLDRLVGDLLDTTRIESGQINIELAEQSVETLVADTVALRRNDSAVHQLKIDLPRDPLRGMCDRGRISQVLNNLISNALKYSPSGVTVTVAARSVSGRIEITVSDEGIGIASEDLENIFKPFHRSSVTRNTIPGIGLGLSASRRILEAHGGTLTVRSDPGRGSTFCISLPIQPAEQNVSVASR